MTTPVIYAPGLSIVKSVTSVTDVNHDGKTDAGDIISYDVLVTNTGDVTQTGVLVTDPLAGGTLASGVTIAVGGSADYQTSYVVKQSDVDANGNPATTGNIKNTATASSDESGPQSSSVTTPVTYAPGLSIVKTISSEIDTNKDGITGDAGDVITYNVHVANTGDVTLHNVSATDPLTGLASTGVTLAVGASEDLVKTYTITQADVDSHGVNALASDATADNKLTNTATATSTETPTPQSSSVDAPLVYKPSLSIVKTISSEIDTNKDGITGDAGDVITYNVHVANTGDVTLHNVSATDPLTGLASTGVTLAVGASEDLVKTYTITQADVDSHGVNALASDATADNKLTNTATAKSTETPTPQSSSVDAPLVYTPGLSILKSVTSITDVNKDGRTDAGDIINYDVKVSNTGDVTLTGLTVTDPLTSSTLASGVTLGVKGVVDYTTSYIITASDMTSYGNPAGTGNIVNTATAVTTQTPSQSSSVQTALQSPGGITVVKLPGQVVVGTCGQVTYTYNVVNTGSTPLTNVHITDNVGTATNPDYITPTAVLSGGFNVGDGNHNGVLDAGETWKYTNTINQSGNYSSASSSCSHSVSGTNLGSGCTAWFNSNFKPVSCNDGDSYTFKNVSCTISGPGCPATKVDVPDACVRFSKSCTQATTTYDSTQNCWVTTLPAGSNPGNVFLSGVPFQVPSGCNLSGATATWNIGSAANNCGSSSLTWNSGCTGYSDFSQNGCDGQNDYNQIGVKVCDNSGAYGCGGNTSSGYGWNYGDSGSYCGTSSGGWGSGYCGSTSGWNGSNSDSCGTPENQYTYNDYGCGGSSGWSGGYYGGYGGCGGGYGGGSDDGACGNGGSGGTVCEGQLTTSSQADTVTVTATTLGSGFSLGDAGNYGIIAFAPAAFKGSSTSPINGNVGLGVNCSSSTVQLAGDKITGNLVDTGTKPSTTGGTVTGTITGNNATLAADISALKTLSSTLGSEVGTSVALSSGLVLNATSGLLDSAGNYVFTITKWANNITINGDGTHSVVLNIASGVTPVLDNVTLTGGLTANQVLFNDTYSGTITGTAGTVFNATFLAPNATFNVTGVTVNGHLFGGASGQNFSFTSNAVLNTPANTSGATPGVTTVTASDSKEVVVLACNSTVSVNGTTPTGSLSSLYGTGKILEFSYNPSDTVSLKQIQTGLGTATGHNASPMAFIAISNNSNPFATGASIYFEGEVVTGEKIFADATLNQLTNTPIAAPNNHFSTTAGSDIFAYVFNSQSDFLAHAAPMQTLAYNTSGSQAMHFGDQIGSLTVVGYVGTTGGHLVS